MSPDDIARQNVQILAYLQQFWSALVVLIFVIGIATVIVSLLMLYAIETMKATVRGMLFKESTEWQHRKDAANDNER